MMNRRHRQKTVTPTWLAIGTWTANTGGLCAGGYCNDFLHFMNAGRNCSTRSRARFVRINLKMGLHQASLCERQKTAAGNDEMIQHPDVHQDQGIFQRLGQHLVGTAGLGHA